MTKYKRAKRRAERDKALKQEKLENLRTRCDNLDSVMTMQHFLEAYNKCKKNVAWKNSVQLYNRNAIVEMYKSICSLSSGSTTALYTKKKVKIYERGKCRVIVPVAIQERVIQRVICDYCLTPLLGRSFIYDNGAGTSGKGSSFTRKRLMKHFNEAKREYGNDFYALTFDFEKFFDNLAHKACFDILDSKLEDKRMVDIVMCIIKAYERSEAMKIEDSGARKQALLDIDNNKYYGLSIGSQVSQVMALAVPNELDHFIKDKIGVKYYVRYMDDGIIFHKDKRFLQDLYYEMKQVCKKIGLKFNERKTRIVKVSKGFTFMKIKYRITNTGKIIRTLARSGITRMRRKLKRMYRLVTAGAISVDDVINSLQSWLAHTKNASAYKTRKRMIALFYKLFGRFNNGRCIL